MRRRNLVLALSVLVGALFSYFFVCPYLELLGAGRLCIALYALLLLLYVYARANPMPVRRRRSPPEARG
jgi:hypothetical protein